MRVLRAPQRTAGLGSQRRIDGVNDAVRLATSCGTLKRAGLRQSPLAATLVMLGAAKMNMALVYKWIPFD